MRSDLQEHTGTERRDRTLTPSREALPPPTRPDRTSLRPSWRAGSVKGLKGLRSSIATRGGVPPPIPGAELSTRSERQSLQSLLPVRQAAVQQVSTHGLQGPKPCDLMKEDNYVRRRDETPPRALTARPCPRSCWPAGAQETDGQCTPLAPGRETPQANCPACRAQHHDPRTMPLPQGRTPVPRLPRRHHRPAEHRQLVDHQPRRRSRGRLRTGQPHRDRHRRPQRARPRPKPSPPGNPDPRLGRP